MTLAQMTTRVAQRLGESGGATYYPVPEIHGALNEGLRLFCLATLCMEKTATWTPAATWTHMMTVFSDWVCILRIQDSLGRKIRPCTLPELIALDDLWIFSTGTTTRYVSLGADLIGIYPTNNGQLTVTYAATHPAITLDTDVPLIPEEYHAELIKFALYRLRQVEGANEFAKTLPLLGEFLDACEKFGTYVRGRNLGSRYDKPAFELAKFDRSKLLTFRTAEMMPATEAAGGTGTLPLKEAA